MTLPRQAQSKITVNKNSHVMTVTAALGLSRYMKPDTTYLSVHSGVGRTITPVGGHHASHISLCSRGSRGSEDSMVCLRSVNMMKTYVRHNVTWKQRIACVFYKFFSY